MSSPYFPNQNMAKLIERLKQNNQFVSILDIHCDHYSEDAIIYHSRWELNDEIGWSVVKGKGEIKDCFEAIQYRSILDSIGKKDVPTEYEYVHNAYRIPFGKYQGLVLEDVPSDFLEHWASKDPDDYQGESRQLISQCKQRLA